MSSRFHSHLSDASSPCGRPRRCPVHSGRWRRRPGHSVDRDDVPITLVVCDDIPVTLVGRDVVEGLFWVGFELEKVDLLVLKRALDFIAFLRSLFCFFERYVCGTFLRSELV